MRKTTQQNRETGREPEDFGTQNREVLNNFLQVLEAAEKAIQRFQSQTTLKSQSHIQQLIKGIPVIKSIKKKIIELLDFCLPPPSTHGGSEEARQELKKNQNQLNQKKSQGKISHMGNQQFPNNIGDGLMKEDGVEGSPETIRVRPWKQQIQHIDNYQFQEASMKKGQNQGYWKNQNMSQSLMHQSSCSSSTPSNISAPNLPMLSLYRSTNESVGVEDEYNDDPLINMKKFKIQQDKNEEDWNQADTTMSKIKQILFTLPQDSHLNSQIQIKTQLIDKLKQNLDEPPQIAQGEAEHPFEEKECLRLPEELDTNEELSSRRSPHKISISPFVELTICPKVYEFNFYDNNSIHSFSELNESKRTDQEPIQPFTTSMIDNMSMQVGSPVYFLNDNQSEGNKTDRSIYMQEKFNLCLNENNLSSREFQEPLIDISEFYEIRQKLIYAEQQKNNLFDKLRLADQEIRSLRVQLSSHKQLIRLMESGNKEKQFQFQVMLGDTQNQFTHLYQLNEVKELKIHELEEVVEELHNERVKLGQLVKENHLEMERLNLTHSELKDKFQHQVQQLDQENNDKTKTIKDLEKELLQLKNELKVQIVQLTTINDELRDQIQQLSKDNDGKRTQIEKMKLNHEELLASIQRVCNEEEEEDGMRKIYSNQLEKLKQNYHQELSTHKHILTDLHIENQHLRQELKTVNNNYKRINITLQNKQKQIKQLQVKTPKGLSPQVEEEISYLRKELVSISRELEKKNNIIEEQNIQLKSKRSRENLKIQVVNEEDNNTYILELKELITYYERTTSSHQKLIQELHENICEFMEDGINKESQLQVMEEQLNILKREYRKLALDRLTLEKDNERLKNMLTSSEQKISAIGNMMIHRFANKKEEKSNTNNNPRKPSNID